MAPIYKKNLTSNIVRKIHMSMRVKSNTLKGGTVLQGTKCGKVVQLINVSKYYVAV